MQAIAACADEPGLTTGEKDLLDGIARGEAVRTLADQLGYSERHTHRLLRRLYDRRVPDD